MMNDPNADDGEASLDASTKGPPLAPSPGHPLSVCLAFDFDATSSWVARGATSIEMSRGEFGAVAIPRILAMLARHDVISTFFVPGHTALAYPYLIRQIAEAGHEIAHHGWVHENAGAKGIAEERRILERGFEALDRVAGIRPVGYRAPGAEFQFSAETVSLFREFGFLYDSSCQGDDYTPYYLREGDSWSKDGPFIFGSPCDLVESPVNWVLDDVNLFEFRPGYSDRQAIPSEVEELWAEELEFAIANVPGGIYNTQLHPQAIGRGPRLAVVERLIERVKDREGVVFESVASAVARWRAANPFATWAERDLVHSGVEAIKLDGTSASLARGASA